MTMTHLSHYGLTLHSRTDKWVLLDGTLADCKRMAAAHGLEVLRTEGRMLGMNGRQAMTNEADVVRYVLTRGMVQKTRDGWCLMMPADVWNERL